MKNYDLAGATLEELCVRFPKSTLRERAYIRAAENYKKSNKIDKAAQVYQTAANNITKAEFAIPSLSSAAECYQKITIWPWPGNV